MKIYHSTTWENLISILESETIVPQELSREDRKAGILKELAGLGIKCIWLSTHTQSWASNRFGAYVFEFRAEDVVFSDLINLGEYNGARCYLSVPPLLASWVSKKIEKPTVNKDVETWHPKSKAKKRVDILVGWILPMNPDITFTTTSRIRNFPIEGDANFAKARFLAKILLESDSRFDANLGDFVEIGALLMRHITGRCNTFDKARELAKQYPIESTNINWLEAALTALREADVCLAVNSSAYIGEIDDVAEELAKYMNSHFIEAALTGQRLIDQMDR